MNENVENTDNTIIDVKCDVSSLFLRVGIIKNKKVNIWDFIVDCKKYKNGKSIDDVLVFIKVETCFKRKSSMKYAKSKVLQELNKNNPEFTTDRFQYYSIF